VVVIVVLLGGDRGNMVVFEMLEKKEIEIVPGTAREIQVVRECRNCGKPVARGLNACGMVFCSKECVREFFVECGERGGGDEPRNKK